MGCKIIFGEDSVLDLGKFMLAVTVSGSSSNDVIFSPFSAAYTKDLWCR